GLCLLAESPHLPNLADLTIEFGDFTTAGVRALAASPHRAGLRRLNLHYSVWRDAARRPAPGDALAGPDVGFRLPSLSRHGHSLRAAGAGALAGTENLSEVKELVLLLNALKDEGVIALAVSPYLRGLSSLVLQTNDLTTVAVRELVE